MTSINNGQAHATDKTRRVVSDEQQEELLHGKNNSSISTRMLDDVQCPHVHPEVVHHNGDSTPDWNRAGDCRSDSWSNAHGHSVSDTGKHVPTHFLPPLLPKEFTRSKDTRDLALPNTTTSSDDGSNSSDDNASCRSTGQGNPTTSMDRPSTAATLHGQVPLRAGDGNSGKSSATKKREKSKKDRSNLRKGKWTVEEEEYTSRIISQFSTGLLTLPEGSTLRSFLAEKLTCDPMRITKKFAGASCLGKRVYHLCDKAQATNAQIEIAKQELSHLEQRFCLRVEHGQSGSPLPRTIVMPTTPVVSCFPAPPVATPLPQWLAAVVGQPGSITLAPNLTQIHPGAPQVWPYPQPPVQFSIAAPPVHAPVRGPHAAPPYSLASHAVHHSPAITIVSNPSQSPAMSKAANDALTSWAWAQAAASLTPALSQLAAVHFQQQQQQLQKAYESQRAQYQQQHLACAPIAPLVPTAPMVVPLAPVSIMCNVVGGSPASFSSTLPTPYPVVVVPTPSGPSPVEIMDTAIAIPNSPSQQLRSKEDEDAGSMLMGFLSSLREGFMEAVDRKDREEQDRSNRKRAYTSVKTSSVELSKSEVSSGTTSHPADSSLEDSGSDKGRESSSSEDSDKDIAIDRPMGPLRKRIKMKKISEFTSKNVEMHNRAMIALHGDQNGYKQGNMPERSDDPTVHSTNPKP